MPPVANGLTIETKSKNNPHGDKIHCGAMVEADIFKAFSDMCDRKLMQKTSVLRKLIADFSATGDFNDIKSK